MLPESASGRAIAGDGTGIAWSSYGSGRPVLLVMGLGADGSAWQPHLERLALKFRCIVVDNRGCGSSEAPVGPYTTEQMADDCAAVITAAGEEAVAVIGISMGGAIAQQLALRHAPMVTALILASSWAGPNAVTEDVLTELEHIRRVGDPEMLARRLDLLIWSPNAYMSNATQLRAERAGVTDFAMAEHAFMAQSHACRHHNVRGRLDEISVPTLVTAGSFDVFTPLACSQELARHLPNASLVTFTGGHAHHWEELDPFNRTCEEFLDAHA